MCGIVLAGGLLRVFRIGSEGLWLDEAFSVWMGWQPLPKMLGWVVLLDQHPPLYYTILHFWMRLGDDPVTVRWLSAIVGTLTIPVIYLLGKRLMGVREGLLAALLLAIAPFHVRFAQEARMYALLCLSASLALLALAHILTDSGAATVPIGSRLAWIGYILFTVATMLSHNAGLLFPVAVNLFVVPFILLRRRQIHPDDGLARPGFTGNSAGAGQGADSGDSLHPPSPRQWILAQLCVLLLWSPWLPAFLVQARGVYREFWIAKPTLTTVVVALGSLLGPQTTQGRVFYGLVAAISLALAWLGAHALRRRSAVLALLSVLFLAPIAGELLISLRRPVFYDRTLIWITVPLYLLFAAGLAPLGVPACGVARLGRRATVVMVVTLMLALNGAFLRDYYYNFEKEQWREAAAYVSQRAEKDDLLLFNATWVQIPFDYYYRSTSQRGTEHGVPVDLFGRNILEPKMTRDDVAYLQSLIRGRDRVWLIYSHNWYTDPEGLIPRALAGKLRMLDQRRFYGLEVRLYGAPGNPEGGNSG